MFGLQAVAGKGGGTRVRPLFSRSELIGILVGLAFPSLIFFNTLPDDQWYLFAPVIIVFLLVFLLGSSDYHSIGRISVVDILSTGALAFLLVQVVFSDWPWLSLWMGFSLSLFPIGCLVSYRLLNANGRWLAFLSIITVGSVHASIIVLQGVLRFERPAGFLDDANLAGNIVSITMILLSYCVVFGKSKSAALILYVSSIALFFTQSRGAILALGLAYACILFGLWVLKDKLKLKLFSLVIGVVVFGALTFVFLVNYIFPVEYGVAERTYSAGIRFDLWVSSLKLFVMEPFLGSGAGTFMLRYPAIRPLSETGTTGYFAHSDYLQFLVEFGIFGFLLLVALPVFFIFCLARWALGKAGSSEPLLTIFATGMLVLISSHAVITFVFYHPFVSLALGFLLGAAFKSFPLENITLPAVPQFIFKFLKFSLLVFLSFLIVSFYSDQKASTLIDSLEEDGVYLTIRSDEYFDLMKLEYFSPFNVNIKNYLVYADASAVISLSGSGLEEGFKEKTLEYISNNERLLSPNCVQGTIKANLIGLDDNFKKIKILEDLIEVAPNCLRARVALADEYSYLERFEESLVVLNGAVDRLIFRESSHDEMIFLFERLERVLDLSGRAAESKAVRAYRDVLEGGKGS